MLLLSVLFTVWNGVDRQEAVLNALSYTPIMPFKCKYWFYSASHTLI